jgi:subtilisin family serine protease
VFRRNKQVTKMSGNFLRAPPLKIQNNAIWNLDALTAPYTDDQYKYRYNGTGVRAYVLDTGIQVGNAQFGRRAKCGFDAFGTKCVDKHGHGSHVSGTVGGKTYGVAKNVALIGVKVLNDTGYGEDAEVIAGIDYVTGQKKKAPKVPMVINMSLGGDFVQILNDAVQAAVKAGVTVVVSAGNDSGLDACLKSPASSPDAITVGATTSSNYPAFFTNGGPCVDIMAPGDYIESIDVCDPETDWFCFGDSTFLSGTSMSAPHVTGVAALHLQKYKNLKPAQVWNAMKSGARVGVIDDFWGYDVPNLLLSANKLII